ncbi:putative ABC transport system permease protein [Anaerocolumna jejuensis DSM 15929]|uniref:Putative ABC transport system permease protein n=1 Tax=Anaerocolumna jejuensis DSM 15929 TaxID=1121322 RepID=A0A1M6PXR5_9FIRM|nr:ABC transporter permease [Anaerocolumna jejuensis]SHK12764.1 putative ABC transport system permease protein [Anaerocolumna jejuensis DSM 15929]
MFQNNNRGVIKHISAANLRSSKMRNRLAGIVIALAAFLLTLTLTFGYNADMEMKNRTSYQGVFENSSVQVIERIRTNPDVKAFGTYRQAGIVKNKNISLSLLYSDVKMLELSNVRVKTGSIPENTNQIAIEKGYLDSIQPGAQIGDTITLNYRNNVSKEMQTNSFVITGFLETGAESEPNRKTFNAIVSQAFINSDPALSSAYLSVVIQIADADKYSNGDLKKKIKEVGEAVGLPEQSVRINYVNIDSNNATPETTAVVFAIVFIIVTACALVIYNIFYIAIMRKVREYGQLRIIGTTRKQIRRMVFREGKVMSLQYIPLGTLAGCGVSYALRPSMWLMRSSVILALCAGGAAFLTVMLSIRKPARIAAGVSPMEAARYTNFHIGLKSKRHTSKRLTPYALGRMYLARNRKKTAVTFLSLTLSGILLIAAASLLSSVETAKRAGHEFPYGGEYRISLNDDLVSPSTSYSDLQIDNPLSDELKTKISSISGVDSVEVHKYIKSRLEGVKLDDGIIGIDNIREKDYSKYEKYMKEGALPEDSAEDMQILVNRGTVTYEYFGLHYKTGDKIAMDLYDGDKQIRKEFIVSGVIENKSSSDTFFLPDKVMDEIMTRNCNLSFEILSGRGYSADVEAQLLALTSSDEKLEYVSLKEQAELYKSVFHVMIITVYAFVAVIACFGLVNLVNTIITNILSRKNEIGILQAVGLSRTQLLKMLNTENAYLIYGSFALSVLLGSILGYAACRIAENTGGLSYFIQYKFPLSMIGLYFILITALQIAVTRIIGYSMQKQSVVVRLQEVS